jgi:hypothetical protein
MPQAARPAIARPNQRDGLATNAIEELNPTYNDPMPPGIDISNIDAWSLPEIKAASYHRSAWTIISRETCLLLADR